MPRFRPITATRLTFGLATALALGSVAWVGGAPSGSVAALQGAWRLVDVVGIDTAGKASAPVPEPGLVIVAGHQMSRTWTDTTGQPANFKKTWAPTDSEALQRFGAIIASAGHFEVMGDTIVYHPITARIPGFEGGRSKDLFTIHGDTLTMTMVSIVASNGQAVGFYAAGGKQRQRLVRVR